MAKLTTKARNAMPASKFAGPGRSYPVPDNPHAANAKARASEAVNAGRMPAAEEKRIDAKADRVLHGSGEKTHRDGSGQAHHPLFTTRCQDKAC